MAKRKEPSGAKAPKARSTDASAPSTAPKKPRATTAKRGAAAAPKVSARSVAKGHNGGQPSEPQILLSHDEIARRAYEIWLSKGRPVGQDEQNWHEAEEAVRRGA